jgi:hypothetical protein
MKPAHPSRVLYPVVVILTTVFALPCLPQKLDAGTQEVGCLSGLGAQSGYAAGYRALREVADLGTHQHWLLIQDLTRATGPALFMKQPQHSACAFLTLGKMNFGSALGARVRSIPVIHAGDRIILCEHTILSDAELEATALEAAAVGESLRVRIKFGGLTVRAIAAAPGRATLVPEASERRP